VHGSATRRVLAAGLIGAALGPWLPIRSEVAGAPAASAVEGRGVRTLYLIRHGAYDEEDARDAEVGKALTSLGREQVQLVARRLASLPAPIGRVHGSTMTRARQTAEIIARALGRPPLLSRDLRECTPPGPGEPAGRDSSDEMEECRDRLERAFRNYFRPTSGADSSEVIACHGNVIRYFWCRALGADPTLWRKLRIAHCSLTVIEVRADGILRPVSFNDVGHLPPGLQTYASPPRAAREEVPQPR